MEKDQFFISYALFLNERRIALPVAPLMNASTGKYMIMADKRNITSMSSGDLGNCRPEAAGFHDEMNEYGYPAKDARGTSCFYPFA